MDCKKQMWHLHYRALWMGLKHADSNVREHYSEQGVCMQEREACKQ